MSSVKVMGTIATLLLAVAAVAPATAHAAGGINMKPGVWEITTSIEASDSVTQRTVTSRICYSNDDVVALTRVLPSQRGAAMKCLAQDVKSTDANSGTWKLACQGKDRAFVGNGSIKALGTTYTAQADLESKAGAKSVHVSEKTAARWVEPCH